MANALAIAGHTVYASMRGLGGKNAALGSQDGLTRSPYQWMSRAGPPEKPPAHSIALRPEK